MPPHHGVGSNDGERTAGFRKQVADPAQDHSVNGRKWQTARFAPSQHDDLLSHHQHLGPQRRAWPEQIDDGLKNYPAEIQHAAEDHPILRLIPTGWNLRQGQVGEQREFMAQMKAKAIEADAIFEAGEGQFVSSDDA
jgi:hypothetical protein